MLVKVSQRRTFQKPASMSTYNFNIVVLVDVIITPHRQAAPPPLNMPDIGIERLQTAGTGSESGDSSSCSSSSDDEESSTSSAVPVQHEMVDDSMYDDAVVGDGTKRWNSVVFPALVNFVKVNGTAKIPSRYTIPSIDAWPDKWHGVALGQTLSQMKRGSAYQTVPETDREELRRLGYDL